MLPELEITEQVANLDGKTAVAIGITNPERKSRQEILIDPNTGHLLGERQTQLPGLPGVMEVQARSPSPPRSPRPW